MSSARSVSEPISRERLWKTTRFWPVQAVGPTQQPEHGWATDPHIWWAAFNIDGAALNRPRVTGVPLRAVPHADLIEEDIQVVKEHCRKIW